MKLLVDKVTALPNELKASTLYLVSDTVNNKLSIVVTSNTGEAMFCSDTIDNTELQLSLDLKVDKEDGKGLVDVNFTQALYDKLQSIAQMATKNASNDFLLNRANHTGQQAMSTVTDLTTVLNTKVDVVNGKSLSDFDFTNELLNKLNGIATGATKNATDAQLKNRATHTGVQPISTVSGLQTELNNRAIYASGLFVANSTELNAAMSNTANRSQAILDISTGKAYTYNGTAWVVNSGVNMNYPAGSILNNPSTGKSFVVNQDAVSYIQLTAASILTKQ
jgi:hypothetical protein